MNNELKKYIENEILPLYKNVDEAHNADNHIRPMIKEALELCKTLSDVNLEMVYVIIAYHDIGLLKGRKEHHIYSKEFVIKDNKLKEWFSEEKINIISEAVEDHRASNDNPPRSIYGMIVADCDRSVDLDEILYKTHSCLSQQYPNADLSTFEKEFEKAYEWVIKKNSEQGYMKFWIDKNKIKKLVELRKIIKDKEYVKERYLAIFEANK